MDYEPDDAGTSVQRVPAATDPFDVTFDTILSDMRCGISLRKALEATSTGFKTFYTYLDRSPEAREQYARARVACCTAWAEQTLEIGDEEPPKVQTDKGEHTDAGFVQWQRLRVETRKWHLAKLQPKVYGDHVHLEHSGNIGNALAERLTDARKRIGSLTGTD